MTGPITLHPIALDKSTGARIPLCAPQVLAKQSRGFVHEKKELMLSQRRIGGKGRMEPRDAIMVMTFGARRWLW